MSITASTLGLVGQHERVGHHQAALGVGVDHLDGGAVTDGDDVAEPIAVPDGMLSVHISQPVTAVGAAQLAEGGDRAMTGAPPDMSFFIWACTSFARLEAEMPPESYMIPLPTMPRWPVADPGGL